MESESVPKLLLNDQNNTFSKFNKRAIGKNVSCTRRQLECGNMERQDVV